MKITSSMPPVNEHLKSTLYIEVSENCCKLRLTGHYDNCCRFYSHSWWNISQYANQTCSLLERTTEEHPRNAHLNTPQSLMCPWYLCLDQQNSSSTGTAALPLPWSQAKLHWLLLHGQVHQSPHRLHPLLCLQLQIVRSTNPLIFVGVNFGQVQQVKLC